MDNLLSVIICLPGVAALILALFLRGDDEAARNNARWLGLTASGSAFIAAAFMFRDFASADSGFQFVEDHLWPFGLTYRVGVDGISVLFVLLTTFLMPLVMLSAWSVTHRVKEYIIALLLLEAFLLGVFCALDLAVFYLFFELAFVPVLALVAVWGGAGSLMASIRVGLPMLLAAGLLLVLFLALFADAGTTDMTVLLAAPSLSAAPMELAGGEVPGGLQSLLFLGLLVAFGLKSSFWPLHAYAPVIHTRIPAGASMIIGAVVLQLLGYGLLRFHMGVLPVAFELWSGTLVWLGAIAMLYGALVAMAQTDMKRMVAYGGVAHLGFVVMAIGSANAQGIEGALFAMLSFGLVAAGLFASIGVIADRMNSHEFEAYGGLRNRMPFFALALLVFVAAYIGVPGTSGFVAVVLSLLGLFQSMPIAALVAAIGLVLVAGYALSFFRQIALGDLIKESLKSIADLSAREWLMLSPLVVMVVILGVYPTFVLDVTGPAVAELLDTYAAALEAHARDN